MYVRTKRRGRSLLGLGLDVPYTDAHGVMHVAHASSGTNCSSDSGSGAASLQAMLNDLGYGPLVVDGQVGPATFKALDAFAQASGVSYQKGSLPKGPICDAVMSAWTAHNAPSAVIPPPPEAIPGGVTPAVQPMLMGPISIRFGSPISPLSKAKNWFSNQSTPIKIGVVGGGIAVVGGLIYMITKR